MNRDQQKGSTAILITVLILGAVLSVTVTTSEILRINLQIDRTQVDSTKSYFATESGAEEYLWLLRKSTPIFDPDVSCVSNRHIITNPATTLCAPPCCHVTEDATPLSNGAGYDFFYTYNAPTSTISIVGIYKDVRRKLQLNY